MSFWLGVVVGMVATLAVIGIALTVWIVPNVLKPIVEWIFRKERP